MKVYLMKYKEEQESLQSVILVLFMSYVSNRTRNCILLNGFTTIDFICNKGTPKRIRYARLKQTYSENMCISNWRYRFQYCLTRLCQTVQVFLCQITELYERLVGKYVEGGV